MIIHVCFIPTFKGSLGIMFTFSAILALMIKMITRKIISPISSIDQYNRKKRRDYAFILN